MIHELKIQPKYYVPASIGKKNFELRKNDRDYKIGDMVILREWDGKRYTERPPLFRFIVYLITSEETGFGLKDGYCILGLE